MKKLGFIFTPANCTGCKACQIACKDKNNLPVDYFFRRVSLFEHHDQTQTYSGACNHCSQADCVKGCPTGALYKAEDGTIQHHAGRCIGCGACVWNCPYGATFLSPTHGISQKCDSCADLRKLGQQPACVQACITHCLKFGEIEDGFMPKFLPDASITVPSLLILQNEKQQPKHHSVAYRKDTHEHFLVLGGGVAALSAIEAIRERNHTCTITLVSAEKELPYSRPMLTKAALRGFDAKPFQILPKSWYDEHNINVCLNTKVQEIKPDEHNVYLHDGQVIHYSKCIYALGAQSFVPPVPGVDKSGVFSIRTLEDIYAMRRWLVRHKQAVLIGGGVIGLETAFELKKYGCDVTVLESAPSLMGRLLDETSAQQLKTQLTDHGIAVHTNIQIKELCGDDNVTGVRLADGRTFSANLVIVTCGVRANVLIAQKAGIEIARGIVVDENMRTNVADLYAAGDCAEWGGINLAVWTEAMEQGRVAGANAAGDPLRYQTVPAAVLMNGKISLYAEGDTGKSPECKMLEFSYSKTRRAEFLVNTTTPQISVERYFFNNDILVGAVLLGDLTRMNTISGGIKEKQSQLTFLERINEAR